ncbi:MAG: bifunctional DNA primase/helicase, partial [Rikenellaceae bacterium]
PPPLKEYEVRVRDFMDYELQYWSRYGITLEVLNSFNVVAIDEFKSVTDDGKKYFVRCSKDNIIFGYQRNNFLKVYQPLKSKPHRFLYGGEVPRPYSFGLEQLPSRGDVLYITGGEKDVLSLTSHGFHAICFGSEKWPIPKNVIRKLSFKFKHIVLLYDMDKTGQEYSLKHAEDLKEFGIKRLLLPLPGSEDAKDISDYFKIGNSADDFKMLFINILDSMYNNTMAILNSCEVDLSAPPSESLKIISINDVSLGAQGNLLCVTGGEGTGKSNFVGSLISGCINTDQSAIDTLGVDIAPNVQNRAVLLYDTEQSEVQLYKNSVNILRRAQRQEMPAYFKAYSLTSMSRKVRLLSIIESMDRFHHCFGGIHLVVIDGIADLIRGANDESDSIAIVEELYRLAGIYNTCIVCVLHFIPNGLKLRGHLGSELQRKSAAIVSIERDNNPSISLIKALKVRDGSPLDIPIIQFGWDKRFAMHRYIGEKPKEDKEKRKEQELAVAAQTIFSDKPVITYNDLCTEIQRIFDIKERAAKNYIKFMRERNIVVSDLDREGALRMGNIDIESI